MCSVIIVVDVGTGRTCVTSFHGGRLLVAPVTVVSSYRHAFVVYVQDQEAAWVVVRSRWAFDAAKQEGNPRHNCGGGTGGRRRWNWRFDLFSRRNQLL